MNKSSTKTINNKNHLSRPIDIHIGSRLKLKRQFKEISLATLEAEAGLEVGSMLNFENGSVTIKAVQLLALSEILNVPISFFYN